MSLEVSLGHAFDGFRVEVAFAAPPGVTALFGRSGAGKSTVVNAVSGLLRPSRGRVRVNGATLLDTAAGIDVPVHQRRIGYVFQDARLFPHLTVRQNLQFGGWFNRHRTKAGATLDDTVEMLGIRHLLERRPGGLSGGEKQRVAIGRALLSRPRLLLMDEPLASLDEPRKAEILPYIEGMRDALDIPILYVSHSIPEVARLATTIVAMSEGRVVRSGPAAEVLADPNAFPLFGRQEVGSILTVTVVAHDHPDGLTELSFAGGRLIAPLVHAEPGATLRVRIRARDIILALRPPEDTSALNILPATVRTIGAQEGPIVDVAVRCGEVDLIARITRRSLDKLGLREGTQCYAMLKSVAVARRDFGIFETRPTARTGNAP
ncbi:MAG: molybdenum ABC transporter ATP-binding protein [Hyphomicrobiaceae bacterium]|nr:molybdenum ABC transporter ATP-binding protein [Hyphomicrobiaceae bacterium]